MEIKRPSLTLTKSEIDQAEMYLRLVKKYKAQVRSVSAFLVGNTLSEEARELAEMRRYPALLTYQDMLDGARSRYQEYLRIVEGESRSEEQQPTRTRRRNRGNV